MKGNSTGKGRIDRIRESSVSMEVGDDSDGAVVSMATINGRMFIIKEGAIYAVSLADHIDPQRTREDIPNTMQKILEVGAHSKLVQRSILTAIELFKKERLKKGIDLNAAVGIVVDIARDLIAANNIWEEFDARLNEVRTGTLKVKGRALTLPSFPSLTPKVKDFVQKMDHAMQGVFKLACVFYDASSLRQAGKWLDGLANHLREKLGTEDQFSKFAAELSTNGKLVRNIRHCIEHPKADQKLLISDYLLTASASIEEPTVQVIHKETPIDAVPVDKLMKLLIDNASVGLEVLMAYLASYHLVPLGGLDVAVGELPEEQRRLGVRFGYLVNLGGRLTRLD